MAGKLTDSDFSAGSARNVMRRNWPPDVHPDRPGTVAVAEHPGDASPCSLRTLDALGVRRQLLRRLVERLDLLRDGDVFVGDSAVGDLGVNERHVK